METYNTEEIVKLLTKRVVHLTIRLDGGELVTLEVIPRHFALHVYKFVLVCHTIMQDIETIAIERQIEVHQIQKVEILDKSFLISSEINSPENEYMILAPEIVKHICDSRVNHYLFNSNLTKTKGLGRFLWYMLPVINSRYKSA